VVELELVAGPGEQDERLDVLGRQIDAAQDLLQVALGVARISETGAAAQPLL
jgi:hypothetical protein